VVLDHPAVRTLNHAAFRVLVLLAAQFSGYNNGSIGLTFGQAQQAGVGSRKAFYGALKDLESRKLIQLSYAASRVPPRPTMWILTWLAVDDTAYSTGTRVAAHDYRHWNPGSLSELKGVRK